MIVFLRSRDFPKCATYVSNRVIFSSPTWTSWNSSVALNKRRIFSPNRWPVLPQNTNWLTLSSKVIWHCLFYSWPYSICSINTLIPLPPVYTKVALYSLLCSEYRTSIKKTNNMFPPSNLPTVPYDWLLVFNTILQILAIMKTYYCFGISLKLREAISVLYFDEKHQARNKLKLHVTGKINSLRFPGMIQSYKITKLKTTIFWRSDYSFKLLKCTLCKRNADAFVVKAVSCGVGTHQMRCIWSMAVRLCVTLW